MARQNLPHPSLTDSFEKTVVSERQSLAEEGLIHFEHAAAHRRHRAFDYLLQLADIPLLSVGDQPFHRLVGNALDDDRQAAEEPPRDERRAQECPHAVRRVTAPWRGCAIDQPQQRRHDSGGFAAPGDVYAISRMSAFHGRPGDPPMFDTLQDPGQTFL